MIHIPVPQWEHRLLHAIAQHGRHPILDRFMVAASDPYRWLPYLLVLIFILGYQAWWATLQTLLIAALGAGISDAVNTRLIKPNTDRIRPGRKYDNIPSLGTMNRGKYAFSSNHASNTIAFAIAFSLQLPVLAPFLFPMVFIVGYSRVYCGAHHPLDVVAGWIHGFLWTSMAISGHQLFFG